MGQPECLFRGALGAVVAARCPASLGGGRMAEPFASYATGQTFVVDAGLTAR
jgi:hypothetical protein